MSPSTPPCSLAMTWLFCASAVAACGGDDATPAVDAALAQDAALDAGIVEDASNALDASEDAAAQQHDASGEDAGGVGCVPFAMPTDCVTSSGAAVPADGSALPTDLRCTGLYGDFASRTLACDLIAYAPSYELWSDGAQKQRWAFLPPGQALDASDPDDIRFPVGTKFWKEFRVDTVGGGSRLAETRIFQKYWDPYGGEDGMGGGVWLSASYVWSEDESSAVMTADQNKNGVNDLYGTGHVVPTQKQCGECHGGRPDNIMGWDSVLLDDATRAKLVATGALGTERATASTIPGSDVERAALGYLHVNCGVSCHNDAEGGSAKAKGIGFYMRLNAADLTSVHDTAILRTGIDKLPDGNAKIAPLIVPAGGFVDIAPGNTERSLVLARMRSTILPETRMPTLGSLVVDDDGVGVVSRWISQMQADGGM